MSGTSFDQSPNFFSVADYRDTDTFALNCTDNMLARADQIGSVGTGIVTRTDGVVLTSADYTVSAAQILGVGAVVQLPNGASETVVYPGTWFSWSGSGGLAGVGYSLTWPLHLTKNGSVIYRTVGINVDPIVG
jgi:hypothetical protein